MGADAQSFLGILGSPIIGPRSVAGLSGIKPWCQQPGVLSFEHTHPPLLGQRPSTTQIGQCVQKGLRIVQALGQDAGGLP